MGTAIVPMIIFISIFYQTSLCRTLSYIIFHFLGEYIRLPLDELLNDVLKLSEFPLEDEVSSVPEDHFYGVYELPLQIIRIPFPSPVDRRSGGLHFPGSCRFERESVAKKQLGDRRGVPLWRGSAQQAAKDRYQGQGERPGKGRRRG